MNTGKNILKLKRSPSDATQFVVAQTQTILEYRLSRLRGGPVEQNSLKTVIGVKEIEKKKLYDKGVLAGDGP